MKITDVKGLLVELPTPRPISDGGQKNQREIVGYVEVFTDEGISGFCPGDAGGGDPAVIDHYLKPMIVGENPLEVERIWTKMFQQWRHPKLDDMLTISRVDCAIWDIVGKALGQPVWRLLGGANRRVPAYAAGGMYQEGKGPAELAAEMVAFVEHGHNVVKMKVAGAPLKEDLVRLKAVREAVGPDVGLMVDINHVWRPDQAIRFGRIAEQFDLYWIEEPVNPWDYKGCAEVAAALDTPIATGENLSSRYTARDLIDWRGADIIQVDPTVCGGITEWRKVAAYAACHNLPVAPHGSQHVGAHCVAGVPNGLIVEAGAYYGLKRDVPPIVEPLRVQDGWVEMTDEPGLGLVVNRDVIHYLETRV
jgi:L-alanine-DL-glutamate epimerase-like enolase superfamily enzyme